MTPELAEVIAAGKALDADEREIAALALLHADDDQLSDDEQAELDDEWDDEIDSRLDDILSGTVQLVDGEESMRALRAELAARRRL